MNSGLYALPGASATATAAAWANRLDEPMTKVSKVYFGLSRVSSRSPARGGLGRSGGAAGEATCRRICRHVDCRWTVVDVAGDRLAGAALRRPSCGVDGDRRAGSRAEDRGQRVLELAAQPALELGAGEVVGDGDDRGVPVEGDRFAGLDPGLLVGLQLLDHALPGGRQVRVVVHRVVPLSSFARARWSPTLRRTTTGASRCGSTGLSTPCERDRLLVETACRDAHGGPAETGSPQVRGPDRAPGTDCGDRRDRGPTRTRGNSTRVEHNPGAARRARRYPQASDPTEPVAEGRRRSISTAVGRASAGPRSRFDLRRRRAYRSSVTRCRRVPHVHAPPGRPGPLHRRVGGRCRPKPDLTGFDQRCPSPTGDLAAAGVTAPDHHRRELVSKRTYQPNNRRRHKVHGFRLRMRTRAGPRDPVRAPPQGPQEPRRLSRAARPGSRSASVLPAPHRLTRGGDFRRVVRTGRRSRRRTSWSSTSCRRRRPDRPPARVGFVVSKAVGNAVVRNRVKRRLRHLCRERLDVLPGRLRAGRPRAPAGGRARRTRNSAPSSTVVCSGASVAAGTADGELT